MPMTKRDETVHPVLRLAARAHQEGLLDARQVLRIRLLATERPDTPAEALLAGTGWIEPDRLRLLTGPDEPAPAPPPAPVETVAAARPILVAGRPTRSRAPVAAAGLLVALAVAAGLLVRRPDRQRADGAAPAAAVATRATAPEARPARPARRPIVPEATDEIPLRRRASWSAAGVEASAGASDATDGVRRVRVALAGLEPPEERVLLRLTVEGERIDEVRAPVAGGIVDHVLTTGVGGRHQVEVLGAGGRTLARIDLGALPAGEAIADAVSDLAAAHRALGAAVAHVRTERSSLTEWRSLLDRFLTRVEEIVERAGRGAPPSQAARIARAGRTLGLLARAYSIDLHRERHAFGGDVDAVAGTEAGVAALESAFARELDSIGAAR